MNEIENTWPNLDEPMPMDIGPATPTTLATAIRDRWTQRPNVYLITTPGRADHWFRELEAEFYACQARRADRSIRTTHGKVQIITTKQPNRLRGPIGRFIIDHGALDGLDAESAERIRTSAEMASR